jgi:hypothetical protein
MKIEDQKHWSEADENGVIHVPDYLDKLVNKVGMQIKFHTISGKNEIQTVCDIVAIAEKFFKDHYEGKGVADGR